MSQIAASHLSKPRGDVLHDRADLDAELLLAAFALPHAASRKEECSALSQRGQVTPFGQRSGIMKLRQASGPEKYRMASSNV